jgi:hypothetical protein
LLSGLRAFENASGIPLSPLNQALSIWYPTSRERSLLLVGLFHSLLRACSVKSKDNSTLHCRNCSLGQQLLRDRYDGQVCAMLLCPS